MSTTGRSHWPRTAPATWLRRTLPRASVTCSAKHRAYQWRAARRQPAAAASSESTLIAVTATDGCSEWLKPTAGTRVGNVAIAAAAEPKPVELSGRRGSLRALRYGIIEPSVVVATRELFMSRRMIFAMHLLAALALATPI